MKRGTRRISTRLAIIGTGIAGFAASLFALNRGLEVAQFGHSGALAYTTGYLDLLGVQGGAVLDDPWAGLDALCKAEPGQPYARLSAEDIRAAFGLFTQGLTDMGLGYTPPGARNLPALLPYGVTKPTLSVPLTMRPGIEAMQAGAPTLIVGFEGLQGFSAAEFRVNMASRWPGLRAATIAFPGMEGAQVFAEVMARALETPATRAALAERLRPLREDAEFIGLPAILGMHAPQEVLAEMERLTGARLFEIPTIPPAVPGIRLREAFERALPARGVRLEPSLKVRSVTIDPRAVTLSLKAPLEDLEVEAEAVILATGRFLSGGLSAERDRLSETLLDLPIRQPAGRDGWFNPEYLGAEGHPVNRLGIETDARFRPLGADGAPVDERLFAAGSILAGQDWVRQRCGAGLAIASAFGAVCAAAETVLS